jgi:hypothetical protein
MDASFKGGVNIAIKIPKSKYEETVAFYRDISKLEFEEKAMIMDPAGKPFIINRQQ